MSLYTLENIPTTTSWIKALTKAEAQEQCKAFMLLPTDNLEEMRVILGNFVKAQNKVSDPSSATALTVDLPQSTNSITNQLSKDNKKPQQQTPAMPPPTKPPSQSQQIQVNPVLNDPSFVALIQSIQQITTQAVAETAKAFHANILTTNSQPQSPDRFTVPHIVKQMLSEIPPTSNNDPITLIKFLLQIQKIISLNLTSESSVITNALPLTRHSLRDVWLQALAEDLDWEQLKERLKSSFLMPRTLREAQTNLLYRRQHQTETLSHFASDIDSMFQFLDPSVSTQDRFHTVFTGLNQTTRVSLAGLPTPNSVQDLINLAPMVDSLQTNQHTDTQPQHSRQHTSSYHQPRNQAFNRQYTHYSRPNTQYRPQFPQNNQQQNLQNHQHRYHQPQNQNNRIQNPAPRYPHPTQGNQQPNIPPFPLHLATLSSPNTSLRGQTRQQNSHNPGN